jgi:hypothetical protein
VRGNDGSVGWDGAVVRAIFRHHVVRLAQRNFHRIACRVLLLALMAAPFARQVEAPALAGKWTTTDPPINFVHIEFGEINRRGEAVGFHHRPTGVDPPGARLLRIVQPPDANGVYRARVALHDPSTDAWIPKKGPSTFYPDRMTPMRSSMRSLRHSTLEGCEMTASSSDLRAAAL